MKITKIHIEQIRGIDSKDFELNLFPNTPSILVAPNGYGKSSIATAFNSLTRDRLEVSEDNRYKHKTDNNPMLQLTLEDDSQYTADSTSNSISPLFSTFVINSQLYSKHTSRTFNGHSVVQSAICVEPIVLVKSIPEKKEFEYSFRTLKSNYPNAGKLFINLNAYLKNPEFLIAIAHQKISLDKLTQVRNQTKLNNFFTLINSLNGSRINIINGVTDFSDIESVSHMLILSNVLNQFWNGLSKLEMYVNIIQLLEVYKSNQDSFLDIIKYYSYIQDEKSINEMLPMFNCTWKEIKANRRGGQLLLEFPKAAEISNGERDVLCFIGKLFESKFKLKKDKSILLIDEIFDYLDDANLISVQYFLNKFMDSFNAENRELYPIILTHLDPLYFNTYSFSTKNVQYLDKIRQTTNLYGINNLLKDRDKCKKQNTAVYNAISSHYLHHHIQACSSQETIEYLRNLHVDTSIQVDTEFKKVALKELDKYKNGKAYDLAFVCCGLRILVEKKACDQLTDEQQLEFIEHRNLTIEKLRYAKECGAEVPEICFLLSIIYNEAMHLDSQCKKLNPISYKLKNKVIKNMICEL